MAIGLRSVVTRAHMQKALHLTNFTDLGLNAGLIKALTEEGYTAPTPIQAQAIPIVMSGADMLGIAQTGTGKTAAFALPILHRLAAEKIPAMRKGARVLVLSPTRELASQIAESFKTYGRHVGVTVGIVFGGVAHGPQRNMLARGVDVLVATPGRLLDHIQQGNCELKGTEMFVLDEADQMLDLGFLPPIRRIVAKLSQRRQNLFFSATMPTEIGKLAGELLKDPKKVSVAPAATTVERVTQSVIHIEANKKRALLVDLFKDADLTRTLVFTRTKRGADKVAAHLESAGIEVAAIHGNKSQNQREQALRAFKQAQIRVLVATDIAARGIDVDLVSHVINFELPDVPESYVHRIGRTARAGASGRAISLVDSGERGQLRDIERITRQQIASEDRRNDASLDADKTPMPADREPRGGRPGAGRGRPGGAARRGAGASDGAPREQRGRSQARPAGDRRPAEARARPEDRAPRPEHRAENRADRPAAPGRPPRAEHADRPERSAEARRPANRPNQRPAGERHRDGGERRPQGEAGNRARPQGARGGDRQPAAQGKGSDLSSVPFLRRPSEPRRDAKPARSNDL
jgi:ATP-dependent RNA helicase RhlE